MSKTSHPLIEPPPPYMRKIGMMAARYVDGVPPDGGAAPVVAPVIPPKPADAPTGTPTPTPPPATDDSVAKLAAAEKRAADAEAALQKIEDDKLSDVDRANKAAADAAAELSKARLDNMRLTALADNPVPKEYQDLVIGTDAASFEASAKKIAALWARAEGKAPPNPPLDPIPPSGTGGGGVPTGKDAGIAEARRRGFIKD